MKKYRWLGGPSRFRDATIERFHIAEPDASDYAFLQINSARDKVAA
jgi:hypothetical protein